VLTFDQVEAVHHHGLDHRYGGVKLELLTVVAAPPTEAGTDVTLVFAGEVAIRLRVRQLAATLADFGDPFAAKVAPRHDDVADPVRPTASTPGPGT
jgi:hypothetical protein